MILITKGNEREEKTDKICSSVYIPNHMWRQKNGPSNHFTEMESLIYKSPLIFFFPLSSPPDQMMECTSSYSSAFSDTLMGRYACAILELEPGWLDFLRKARQGKADSSKDAGSRKQCGIEILGLRYLKSTGVRRLF